MRISYLSVHFLTAKKAPVSKAKNENTSSSKIILRGFVLISHWHQWILVLNSKENYLKMQSSLSERIFNSGTNDCCLLQDCDIFCQGNGT